MDVRYVHEYQNHIHRVVFGIFFLSGPLQRFRFDLFLIISKFFLDNNFIHFSSFISHFFPICLQSPDSSFTRYEAYAVSVYINNVSLSLSPDSSNPDCSSPLRPKTDSVIYLEHVLDPFSFPTPPNPLILVCSDIPNVNMSDYQWFQVTSNMTLSSDEEHFYLSFERYLVVNDPSSSRVSFL